MLDRLQRLSCDFDREAIRAIVRASGDAEPDGLDISGHNSL
jgi:hypothetical protein